MFSFRDKQKALTEKSQIDAVLSRGVEDVFVAESLRKKLLSGRPLRIKLGFDPTGSKIHIGRAIILRKLRAFQDMGHRAVFIIGDFTAQVGDPSDKLEKRPMLSAQKIKENLKDYKTQIGKIIDLKNAEFHYNSKWLSKLSFEKLAELAESFSVQQMMARRNFKDRIDKGVEISLREFLYPLMQGYDSVMVNADVEIGGFDQLFNLKAGRTIQKHFGMPEQDVLTTKMLSGTDGRKMSTSWGNVINITDAPNDMFGKIMSVRDDLIIDYFTLCTDTSLNEIEKTKQEMGTGVNPRDNKIKLAEEIVSIYHGKESAKKAKENFIKIFSEHVIPEGIEEVSASTEELLSDVAVRVGSVPSKSEFRRLVEGGGVHDLSGDVTIRDVQRKVGGGGVFRFGKRRFLKIVKK